MIWLQEGDILTKNHITSANDDKLKEYIETFGDLTSPKNLIPTINDKRFSNFVFPYERIRESEYVIRVLLKKHESGLIVTEHFHRFKKWLTLNIVKNVLTGDTRDVFLSQYFLDWQKDLEKISSIMDNPYFSEFMQSMYSDYADFISILPYLEIKPISKHDVKNLEKTRCLQQEQGLKTEEVEEILKKQARAKENSKILQKAKLLTLASNR